MIKKNYIFFFLLIFLLFFSNGILLINRHNKKNKIYNLQLKNKNLELKNKKFNIKEANKFFKNCSKIFNKELTFKKEEICKNNEKEESCEVITKFVEFYYDTCEDTFVEFLTNLHNYEREKKKYIFLNEMIDYGINLTIKNLQETYKIYLKIDFSLKKILKKKEIFEKIEKGLFLNKKIKLIIENKSLDQGYH